MGSRHMVRGLEPLWAQVQREIRIHGQLQHEHIIQLYAAFEDAEHVYLALEYASGARICLMRLPHKNYDPLSRQLLHELPDPEGDS